MTTENKLNNEKVSGTETKIPSGKTARPLVLSAFNFLIPDLEADTFQPDAADIAAALYPRTHTQPA